MVAHSLRSHAQWSASATARNWTCPGALAMATIAPPEQDSLAAARGTAAHEIAERCFANETDANTFLATHVARGKHTIEIDEEIVDSAQVYVDYVRALNPDEIWIEHNWTLDAIDPPFSAGGTCDTVALIKAERLLKVIDFKHGVGVVEANENKQLRTYALLALLNLPKDTIDHVEKIETVIVQPRAYHAEGRIRSETFTVDTLFGWAVELLGAMNASKQALDEFNANAGDKNRFEAWAAKWLTPGNCKFCPSEGVCPALRKQALSVINEAASKWFEDTQIITPVELPAPTAMTDEHLGHVLDGLDLLEDWIKAIRETAHNRAENGGKIPGWILVDKIGNRVWSKSEEEIVKELNALGLSEDKLFTRKIVSPAQAEKLLGKRKTEIASLVEKPVKGVNLVQETKTTRAPAKNKIESFFEAV